MKQHFWTAIALALLLLPLHARAQGSGSATMDAVRARDGDAAERAARDHIQSALEIIIARLP